MRRGLIINDYGAIIRTEPDKHSKPLGTVDVFEIVEILDNHSDWKKISSGYVVGYIPASSVTTTGI